MSDVFEEFVKGVNASPWGLVRDEAEQRLLWERPKGFTAQDVGRLAWGWLHKDWHGPVLDHFFYTDWKMRQSRPEELARFEAAQPLHARAAEALAEVDALLAQGAEVTPQLVASLVKLARTAIGGAR
ncbi:hypothetical protein [Streptomyces sp. NEAU-174]|uniref:hypothetical protein n=1 Tax=Streptomyces sp. NEAU-174 TaxID=3458254 RepID=UPI004043B551